MNKYQLIDGRILYASEKNFPGMAGEQMTVLILSIDGKPVSFNTIKEFLFPEDRTEIKNWIDDLSDSNHAAAVAFTI